MLILGKLADINLKLKLIIKLLKNFVLLLLSNYINYLISTNLDKSKIITKYSYNIIQAS